MEQPNATGDGEAKLTLRFWAALVLTGLVTGQLGALMMGVLVTVQHLAYGPDSFSSEVRRASWEHRVVVLAIGGLVVGVIGWGLRKWLRGSTDVDDSVWAGTGDLAFPRSLATGSLSEVAVGVGGSLGQEAAPKLLGAAAGAFLARLTALDAPQRRLLVACGAGAGMGAVYNVPLGGALITAELFYGSLALPIVLPSLVCSAVATIASWLFLDDAVTYPHLPHLISSTSLLVFAALAGPLFGAVAVAFVRGVGWVSHHQLRGNASAFGPMAAFTVLGLATASYPVLLGNGKLLAASTFFSTAHVAVMTLVALVLLKPLITLLCLLSGASGGLFTPVLSTGAALGLLLGEGWAHLWPAAALPAYALVGAAALSGAAMQAPIAATVLVLELTNNSQPVLLPLILATALATTVARYLDGYSVYSARLPALESTG
jgi:CIC family chloride channel protein